MIRKYLSFYLIWYRIFKDDLSLSPLCISVELTNNSQIRLAKYCYLQHPLVLVFVGLLEDIRVDVQPPETLKLPAYKRFENTLLEVTDPVSVALHKSLLLLVAVCQF